MAQKHGESPNHIKLSDSERVLEDSEQDIRGWKVEDETGSSLGTVSELLLNTETEYVDSIVLDDGEEYPIDDTEIGDGRILLVGDAAAAEGSNGEAIQRSEEELRAGIREREAGRIRVRKQVRTDHEQIRVPKLREEISVERVPVEGEEASEAEIGEDEVSVPMVEEEVVVEKKPIVKEELRIRKEVVEEEQVVEEDVRKEEIDIEDTTRPGNR